ncbi:hypothetical protein BDV12DRAFT_200270 [Aspergillus spectabilis]
MGTTLSRADQGLNDLPFEILHEIFRVLAAEHEDDARKGVRPFNPSVAGQALQALAVTSQRIHAIVQPWLYRTIIITSCTQQRQLLMTVDTQPNLANNIKQVIFFEYRDMPQWVDRPRKFTQKNRRRPRTRAGPPKAMGAPTESSVSRNIFASSSHATTNNQPLYPRLPERKVIWRGVHQEEPALARRWDNYDRRRIMRDAVLDLFDLLLRLPKLSLFRYIGRGMANERHRTVRKDGTSFYGSVFQLMFTLVMKSLQPALRSRLFKSLAELDLDELHWQIWPELLGHCTGFPSRTLSLSYSREVLYQIIHPQLWGSHTLRELKLSVPVSLEDFRALLAELEGLEVLYYEYFPPFYLNLLTYGNVPFARYLSSIERRRETLKELHITANHCNHTRQEILDLASHSWASYTQLRVLDVLDMLLYENNTPIEHVILKLPPNLESLTITAWLKKGSAARLMGELASNISYIPTLRKVAVVEKSADSPRLKDLLIPLVPDFRSRGVVFRYSRM